MVEDPQARDPEPMRKTQHVPAGILATTLAVALLTGCSALPGPLGGPGGLEETIEQETGGQVDLGAGASLPADWPAELPLPDGILRTAVSVDGAQTLIFSIADEAVAEKLLADVTALGFEQTSATDLGELVTYILDRDGWSVTIGWILSEEIALTYSSSAH